MRAIDEATAGLNALDLAIKYVLAVDMRWEGPASLSARQQLQAEAERMINIRHRLELARQATMAAQVRHIVALYAACSGVL